ncbi:hypothetical protein, partial [Lacticaseibacillus paracasei]|uniref:hypothetical protein n=1 Tax=Lacticaseibacillus paracasei TaxID=1597 RepID=UPI0021A7AF79
MKNRVLPFLGIVSVSAVVLSTFPATLASAQTSYCSIKLSQVCNRVTAAKKSQEAKIAQLADALKSTTKVYNQVNQQSNATIQTAQGWINRKQGIVNDAQQKSNAANTWLA